MKTGHINIDEFVIDDVLDTMSGYERKFNKKHKKKDKKEHHKGGSSGTHDDEDKMVINIGV